MLRPALRVLSALLVISAAACASPTAPKTTTTRLNAPSAGASFDDVPVDTTCRSDYNVGQGRTC